MKLKKNIKRCIKIALSSCLLAFPSCSYLDVIPPAQPDFDDTMKDESATYVSFLLLFELPIYFLEGR